MSRVAGNAVGVSESVLRGVQAVRQSGLTNMLDREQVARLAEKLGYPDTKEWIESNPKLYSRGVFCGFAVAPDGSDESG